MRVAKKAVVFQQADGKKWVVPVNHEPEAWSLVKRDKSLRVVEVR